MDTQEQAQEHIEEHAGRRFRMHGTRIVATEEVCSHCKERYWQPVVMVGNDPVPLGHSCQPQRLGGASVINKYG